MIPICAQVGPDQLDPTRIALRLVSLLTPLIFAICYVFAHCVLDIHGSPHRSEVIAGLEEECDRVCREHGGLETSESVAALYRIDSALRESMRVSDVAVTNLFRDVTAGEVDIGNGLRVGPGVRMVFPTQNIHQDPENYKDPARYDAFRFSRPFEGDRRPGEQKLISTTTPTFLPFGYGRHACPGRWFAAQLMKQALAYVIMHYEVQLVGGPKPRKALLNTMVPPVGTQIRIRRKD
ncbi:NADP-dependent oxidoreductase domain-containing protein [Apiospora arundinis]